MIELPLELLALPPLALAAGVDLYLTLVVIGAAPTFWDGGGGAGPLPGALGDLDSPAVLLVVGIFYLAEFSAERSPRAALVWNAFHAVIRPLSGALLALLLLDGRPLPVVLIGCGVSGLLASYAHGVRTGGWVLRWLSRAQRPPVVLLSLFEDVVVLGVVVLVLDAPRWAFIGSVLVVAAAAPAAPSLLRAFAYVIRLGGSRIFLTLRQKRWRRPEEIPEWVTGALPSGLRPLRGAPAAAHRLPGAPLFVAGWVVVAEDGPWIVFRRWGQTSAVELASREVISIEDRDLYHRVELGAGDRPTTLLFDRSGPAVTNLQVDFGAGRDTDTIG